MARKVSGDVIIDDGPVVIRPIDIAEKYGVPISNPVIGPAIKYGVPTPMPSNVDLNVSYSQIEENISRLKGTIENLKQLWNVDAKANVNRIKNSWAGADCEAYIERLQNMDKRVNNTISALELLCGTYEKARDMISENQRNTISAISKM